MDDIFSVIVSTDNLFTAWREFRSGKRKKYDVQLFERNFEDNIFSLQSDLRNGVYKHGSYHRFQIHDPKHRVIHKADVRDRLLHHAIHGVLYPIFDRSFIYDSYSCRIGKGAHAGVNRLEKFARKVSRNHTRTCWSLKIDIQKFFDSIDHWILLSLLKKKIPCHKTVVLLEEIVRNFYFGKSCGGGERFAHW
jgi:retron-type reverse transcriptase